MCGSEKIYQATDHEKIHSSDKGKSPWIEWGVNHIAGQRWELQVRRDVSIAEQQAQKRKADQYANREKPKCEFRSYRQDERTCSLSARANDNGA